MINRRVTRCVLNSTEVTSTFIQPDAVQNAFALTTSDFVYVGFHGKFSSRYFQVHTANTNAASTVVEYWDGTAWSAVDDLVDQTVSGANTFAQSGFVSWVNKDNWVVRSLTGVDSDVELYWVRMSVSANLSATTKVHAVLNIFSDDVLLRAYFPELISDVNYLPSGESNFLDQHLAAKDLVVLRLKQRKLIHHEAQIIEANDVAIASVYAAAMLILQPIATSPAAKDLLEVAKNGFDEEITKVTFSVDVDEDGIVDENERLQNFSVEVYRR